jgi:hypothetical protein
MPTLLLSPCSCRIVLHIGLFSSEKFDLVYAVNAFLYLHIVGADLVERHFQEVSRVLKPRGSSPYLTFPIEGHQTSTAWKWSIWLGSITSQS